MNFFTIISLIGIYRGLYLLAIGSMSRRWPTADGVIVESGLTLGDTLHGGPRDRQALVAYEYVVDRKRYTSNVIHYGFTVSSTGGLGYPERMVREYPKGKRVKVRYNPRWPAQAMLRPGGFAAGILVMFIGAIFIAFGTAMEAKWTAEQAAKTFSRPVPDPPAWISTDGKPYKHPAPPVPVPPRRAGPIEIRAAEARQVFLRDRANGRDSDSDRAYLVLRIAIRNAGREEARWDARDPEAPCRLEGDGGERYPRAEFGPGVVPLGSLPQTTIRPGEEVSDILVFEPPQDSHHDLRLVFPKGVLGGRTPLSIPVPPEWKRTIQE